MKFQMKWMLRVTFILTVLMGCASHSNNQIAHDDIFFEKGTYKDQRWDDKLHLARASWYQELFLIYDVMFGKVDEASPFMNWFSAAEKEVIKSCGTFVLNFKYTYGSSKIAHPQFTQEMERQGFREFLVPEFVQNVRVHPDMEKFNLHKHKIAGFCHPQVVEAILINFPGYSPVNIKL